jgi:hypothetical protein
MKPPPSKRNLVRPPENAAQPLKDARATLDRIEVLVSPAETKEFKVMDELSVLRQNLEVSIKSTMEEVTAKVNTELERQKRSRKKLEEELQLLRKNVAEAESNHLKDLQEILQSKLIEGQRAKRFEGTLLLPSLVDEETAEVKILKVKQEKAKMETVRQSLAVLQPEVKELEDRLSGMKRILRSEKSQVKADQENLQLAVHYLTKSCASVEEDLRNVRSSFKDINDEHLEAEIASLEKSCQGFAADIAQMGEQTGQKAFRTKKDFWLSLLSTN